MGEWLYCGTAPQRFRSSVGTGHADHPGREPPAAIGNAGEPSTVDLPSVAMSTPGVVGDVDVVTSIFYYLNVVNPDVVIFFSR